MNFKFEKMKQKINLKEKIKYFQNLISKVIKLKNNWKEISSVKIEDNFVEIETTPIQKEEETIKEK